MNAGRLNVRESRTTLWGAAEAARGPCVLLLERAMAIASLVETGLEQQGFAVRRAASAAEAHAELTTRSCDIALLDLDLLDDGGVEWLRSHRQRDRAQPILVVTAQQAVSTRVRVLDAGADDYLVKPFAFEELVARLRALLRRSGHRRDSLAQIGQLHLSQDKPEVLVRGRPVRLSPKEHALLEHLSRRRDDVVTRAELLRTVFKYSSDPGTNLVDVHMAHLRRKIAGGGVSIETLRGVGFRLSTAVSDQEG